jgi:hypothetical protein
LPLSEAIGDLQISISVYDHESVGKDNFLGKIKLPLSVRTSFFYYHQQMQEIKADNSKNWYSLRDKSSKSHRKYQISGQLLLSFEFADYSFLSEDGESPKIASLRSGLPKALRSILSIIYCISPVLELVFYVHSILTWKDSNASFLAFLFYFWIVYNEYILSFFLCFLFFYFVRGYFEQLYGNKKFSFVPPSKLTVKQLEASVRSTIGWISLFFPLIFRSHKNK